MLRAICNIDRLCIGKRLYKKERYFYHNNGLYTGKKIRLILYGINRKEGFVCCEIYIYLLTKR